MAPAVIGREPAQGARRANAGVCVGNDVRRGKASTATEFAALILKQGGLTGSERLALAGSQTAIGEDLMCILCDRGKPQLHSTSRRNFLKGTATTSLAAGAMALFGPSAEAQGHNVNPPPHTGMPGRR